MTTSPIRSNAGPSGGLSVASLQVNPDGTVRALNGFGVIAGTNSVGREYAERYFRVAARLNF